jgi:acyl-CoA synthetase (NDP forming)/GNAT superfamily N-acetyltransferase
VSAARAQADATSAYPQQWETDAALADGGTVHLRPIRPDDADALQAMHARLSEQTRYLRFFGAYPTIPPRDLERFTVVDHHHRVAIIATLGADIIGVARYDETGPGVAEVAFVVEDRHQGRGLGTLLLEHLAAAARERGITRFEADVLAVNRRMLRVFLDAGYAVEREHESGAVHVRFDIGPTAESIALASDREHRAEAQSIARLLAPRSVVVVGARADGAGIGGRILANIAGYGFRGRLHAVHPSAERIGAVPAYPSVLDVPDDVDLAVVAVPAEAVPAVVAESGRKGVHGVVVVSAGFAETGRPADAARQHDLLDLARSAGMRLVGPNCLGVLSTDPEVCLNATLAPTVPAAGPVGLFSQSGSLGSFILAEAARRGLGLSTFVSAGNRADVSGNDLLQYWEEDPRTEVVLLYLESFGNPHKFGRLARRIAARKAVVVVRTGRATATVPLGHAARPVSLPAEAEAAVFAQAGVVRVGTLQQGLDVAGLLAHQPLPRGRRVAVVGNSFAVGLLAVDACVGHGFDVVGGGPLDLGPDADENDYRAALDHAVADAAADAVVVVFVPPHVGDDPAVGAVVAVVADVAAGSDKPFVATFLGRTGLSELAGVPSFATPESAVDALAHAAWLAEWRQRPVGALPEPAEADVEKARRLARAVLAKAPGGRDLTDGEVRDLLAAVGVHVWSAVRVKTLRAALMAARRLGWPVAVKAADDHLRRRVDLGAVRLNVGDERDLRDAYADVAALGSGQVLVQRMAPPGVPVSVDTVDDPSFGTLLAVGVGGIATELLGDRAYRAVPLTDVDAAEMVRSLRAAPLLLGWRGAEPVDVAALEELLLRVSHLLDEVPEVTRVRLDSVLVGHRGVVALEAAVAVAPVTGRVDAGPRRLR